MGRKSKLSPEQWADIEKRLLDGEGYTALAREFGVGESTIRSRLERGGKKSATVQQVAHMIHDADMALKVLPPAQQVAAVNLASKLVNISMSMATAAEISADSSRRLAAMASKELQKAEEQHSLGVNPLTEDGPLRRQVALQRAANEAGILPGNLLAANKDMVKRLNEVPAEAEDEELTPERVKEGVRRIAFTLHRAAAQPENTHG